MRHALNIVCTIVLGMSALGASIGCQPGRTAEFTYASTPVIGWESSDSLSFPLDTIRQGGDYLLNIGVRTSAANPYPFRTLVLRVDLRFPNQPLHSDTVACQLTDHDGDVNGRGVSLYQYDFDIDTLHIPANTAGHLTIRHLMQKQVITGISDVGFKLSRLP